ncbi:uncharacterized protein PAC_16743 [Phialocephala subalpina]|uniref:Plasmid pRiA4b Orf3-like domain-containing protein n=1 Tax=Phialocephala subalpina TaxID=576137 RepID=A0A1L7XPA4_9HELO|nr:uncharacterized protein PAC_16743 [Phialocephala subalpina]
MPRAARASNTEARREPYNASGRPSAVTSNGGGSSRPAVEEYLLQVRLWETRDPCITRLLSVPSNFTFRQLHEVLQVAFGWTGSHTYTFDVNDLAATRQRGFMGNPTLLTLVEDDDDLDMLPNPVKLDTDYTLAHIYNGRRYKGKVEIIRQMHISEDSPVVCLGGEGHRCAEDCGGSHGWGELKELFKRGRDDEEGRMWWYMPMLGIRDPAQFNPYEWDIKKVNEALADIGA